MVYINAIAWVGDDYEELGTHYRLNTSSPLKPDAIILHPLARGKNWRANSMTPRTTGISPRRAAPCSCAWHCFQPFEILCLIKEAL